MLYPINMKAMRVNFIPTDYFLGMFIGFNAILTPVYASTVVPLIVLFFIIIPFCCLFTYFVLKKFKKCNLRYDHVELRLFPLET